MTSSDPQNLYDENYYKHYCGSIPYERSEHWLTFFGGIAERIVNDFTPKSALDAGCAIGILVEMLCRHDVDAYGFDVSEWAVQQMPAEYALRVKTGSILDPDVVDRHFDIVTCIEVLEHLQPHEADTAVRNLCTWGDIVIFSSSPDDYAEATHFNVQQPGYWAEKFSQHGFSRVLDYDASYIAPWAHVYRREKIVHSSYVRQYENLIWQRSKENVALRDLVTKLRYGTNDIAWYKEEFKRLIQEIQTRDQQLNLVTARDSDLVTYNEKLKRELETDHQQFKNRIDELAREMEISRQQLIKRNDDWAREVNTGNQLRTRIENLEKELESSRQQHIAELRVIQNRNQELRSTIEQMQRTKGWRFLTLYWRLKQRIMPSSHKFLRLRQLSRTARLTLKHDGPAALADRSIRWLHGERRFYHSNAAPSAFAAVAVVANHPPVSDDPFADYPQWIVENEPDTWELQRQVSEAEQLDFRPLISIVTPVFNTDRNMLIAMIESVCAQTYPFWELCLVDGGSDEAHVWEILEDYSRRDNRIKVRRLTANLGISGNSNAALELAIGEFIALLDHDDLLAPFALYSVARVLGDKPELDFIYSDKDMITQDGTHRFHPLFKPDWSPEILLNTNYLTHLCVIRRTLVAEIGGFDTEANGAQDWALFLNVALRTDRVAHIPEILYHWRQHPLSVAMGTLQAKPYATQAQIYSIQKFIDSQELHVRVETDHANQPKLIWSISDSVTVSLVLDITQAHFSLPNLVQTYLEQSPSFIIEIAIVNRSGSRISRPDFDERVRKYDFEANALQGAVYRSVAQHLHGDVLVFLSSDLNPIQPSSMLEELVGWTQYPDIGVVGGMLKQPDGTIASAGLVMKSYEFASAFGYGQHESASTLMGHMAWYRNFSALPSAGFALTRLVLEHIGGFDERLDAACVVDLCLRLRDAGRRNFYTPHARLSYQSKMPAEIKFSKQDAETLLIKHATFFSQGDSYLNPNLELSSGDLRLRGIKFESTSFDNVTNVDVTNVGTPTSTWTLYSREALALTSWFDFDTKTLQDNLAAQFTHAAKQIEINSLTWFLPGFTNPFWGGIHTLLRFASSFKELYGVKSHLVITDEVDRTEVRRLIVQAFPNLNDCEITILTNPTKVKNLPHSDAAICSLWTTAYFMLNFNQTLRKFYFIQDYEPLFYPAGSTSGQVEASYRFGYYGIANTIFLKTIYERDYSGNAEYFTPSTNLDVFYPPSKPRNEGGPYRVFFYGRPGHPRNAFELGAASIRLLKQRMGNRVEVVSAGTQWNQAEYGLRSLVKQYGLLSYEESGELYRSCHAGLVMMFTKHPSYIPFELMASKSLVVTNRNTATSWLLRHGENCLLAEASPTSIAETLEQGLLDSELRKKITENAYTEIIKNYSNWRSEIEKIYAYMCSPKSTSLRSEPDLPSSHRTLNK